jgi:hypothetical protein
LLKRGPGEANVPIVCVGVLIEPGDVILADGDGVLRIPLADAHRALSVAQARARREAEMRAAIAAGANTFEVVGLQAALDASDMIEIDGTWQQGRGRRVKGQRSASRRGLAGDDHGRVGQVADRARSCGRRCA